MSQLYIPDVCAHLDRIKRLCDRLEKAQFDEERYSELARQIRAEMDALHGIICNSAPVAGRTSVRI